MGGLAVKLVKMVLSASGGAVLFLSVFFLIHLPHGPEHWSADLRTALLSRTLDKQYDRITLIEITNDTLQQYPYLSPIDRKLLADLIRVVDACNPKAIGLDLIFDHPTELTKDQELSRAIRDAHAPVVLGALDDDTLADTARSFQSEFLNSARQKVGHLYLGEERSNPLTISEDVIRTIAAPSEGGRPSFAEVLASIDGPHRVDVGRRIAWLLPPRDKKRDWVSWPFARKTGRVETFLTLPADLVLASDKNDLPLKELVRDRFVLIGGTFADRDQHLTPLSVLRQERYGGLFIHAQILAQLLSDEHVYEMHGAAVLALLTVAGVMGIWTGRRSRSGHHDLWIEFISVSLLIVISILTFTFGKFIFPFVSALLAWSAGIAGGHFSKPAV